jgi:hypothetical protein
MKKELALSLIFSAKICARLLDTEWLFNINEFLIENGCFRKTLD